MSAWSERLLRRFYANRPHPYHVFDRRVDGRVSSARVDALLDAGCGRSAPVLRKYVGRVRRLVGVELEEFADVPPEVEVYNADLARLPLADGAIDLVISRSVFEHLVEPAAVYGEFARVLRPGGAVIFLTGNMWDYGTIAARLIPNRFHAWIVNKVEGRAPEDTFPTVYKTNTRGAIERLARDAGLQVVAFEYLSQHPNYMMFNGLAFLCGTAYERLITRFDTLRFLRPWLLVTLAKPGA